MSAETKEILLRIRSRIEAHAEKDLDHARSLFPGTPKRERMEMQAIGLQRALKIVNDVIIEHAISP